MVANVIQRADEVVEVDVAMSRRDEVPAAPMVPERQVAGDDAGFAVAVDLGVLDVDVIDTVGEVAGKDGRVHALPDEVAGIEIEAELRPVVERFQGALGRVEVEGDLRGMDLQGEANAVLAELVHDGIPALGE